MRMPSRATTRWSMSATVTDILTMFYTLTARASIGSAAITATTVRPLRMRQDVNIQTFKV